MPGAYLRALQQKKRPPRSPVPAPGVNWTPIGPSVIGLGSGNSFTEVGRVSALVAGPGGQRVYAGGADGGVWISSNAGVTWSPLNDYFSASESVPGDTQVEINSLSIGAIEVRFGTSADNDEIFVGTGEANDGWPSEYTGPWGPESPVDNYFGVGINHWVGGSWGLEATNLASQGINRIAIDPNDATPINVYAATTDGLFKRPTGGADPSTWNLVTVNPSTPNQLVTDFIAAGSGAGRMFYAALNGDNVYSSPNGSTWTPLSGLGSIPEYSGRIALAASESSPNIVYAIVATGNLYYLDRSAGSTFQQVPGLPAGVPYGTYATCGRGIWEIPLDPAAVGLNPDIYMRVNYADTGRLHGGSRYPWVEGAADPINVGDLVYHWMSADIKVRRSSLPGLPAIGSPATYFDFAFNVGDYVQPSTDIETADVSGKDTIFVEVHNRSVNAPVKAANVRVLLLVADASAALPALPSGWTAHVNSGDTNPSWLGSSGWNFVDMGQPYRTLLGDLDVRTPQVVSYYFDFSTLGLPTGDDHVCLAAFASTVDSSDQITSTNTDPNTVTMTDKHVVQRNLHLVAMGAEPMIRPSRFMTLNFNNPYEREAVFDIAFDRANFPGRIALLLPKLSELSSTGPALDGFKVHLRLELPEGLREMVGGWVENLGELLERLGREIGGSAQRKEHRERRRRLLDRVDRHHVLLAEAGSHPATITGVQIPPNGAVTAVFALSPPPGARKNDRYRLDVIQRRAGRILGGSSYVIAIV